MVYKVEIVVTFWDREPLTGREHKEGWGEGALEMSCILILEVVIEVCAHVRNH